jgi:hypothetical protein
MRALGLGSYTSALGDTIAKKIIESARRGERDPKRMAEQVLAFLGAYKRS